ncbi:MAG: ABC transporter substrate-binding protein [Symbiopectobacterium sp.]
MYRYLRGELGDVPHVGLETPPNLEAIALLKPDLIIASGFRHERMYTLLSHIAPTVVMEDVFKFKCTVQQMGQALDREMQAQGLLTAWQEPVSVLRDRLRAHYSSTTCSLFIRQQYLARFVNKFSTQLYSSIFSTQLCRLSALGSGFYLAGNAGRFAHRDAQTEYARESASAGRRSVFLFLCVRKNQR